MYKSVSFWTKKQQTDTGGRNTWASWRLISATRPQIPPPAQKTYYQEVPYSNSKIDLSTLGLDDAVFENREGSFEFIIENSQNTGFLTTKRRVNDGNAMTLLSIPDGKDTIWDWDTTYSTVMNYIQGETRKIVLEDDPAFYYIGRTEVEDISSEEHFTKLNIKYDVEPFKKMRFSTGEDWIWDAIDFQVNPDILGFKDKILTGYQSFFGDDNIHTLRNKVKPTIHITVVSDPNDEVSHAENGIVQVQIRENGGNWRTVSFDKDITKNGEKIGNQAVAIAWDDIDFDNDYLYSHPVEGFYFEGMSDVEVIVMNILQHATLKITLDYRLEGL